jgi:hypothetical protein
MKERELGMRNLFLGILLMAVLLVGCNMPTGRTPTGTFAEAAYTAAAETIVAQLTEVASTSIAVSTLEPSVVQTPFEGATPTEPLPSPTPSPQFTVTTRVTPTPTTTPTLTFVPNDPRQQLGAPTWRDVFKDGDNWALYEDEHVRFRIKDERLVMTALLAEGRDSWMLARPKPMDYYIEVVAKPGACSDLDRWGIIFRSDASVGYLYGVSCDGQYSLRMWDGEKFKTLIDWTPTPYLSSGSDQENRIGLMVKGSRFSLYVNGHFLAEISDETYEEKGFGVFLGSKNTENFKVYVSEVAYWELSD